MLTGYVPYSWTSVKSFGDAVIGSRVTLLPYHELAERAFLPHREALRVSHPLDEGHQREVIHAPRAVHGNLDERPWGEGRVGSIRIKVHDHCPSLPASDDLGLRHVGRPFVSERIPRISRIIRVNLFSVEEEIG